MKLLIKLDIQEVKKFLLIFYCVAIIGFLVPFTYPYFKFLTPLAILVNIFLLIYFHNKWTKKFIILTLIILITGYIAEVIGINTGLIFGNYTYGKILGPKLFDTPVIIGFNWIMLIYCVYVLISMIKVNALLKILIGACLLVIFDIVMESSAINMGMWIWEEGVIPIKNSVTWFVLSFLLLGLYRIFRVIIRNEIAVYVIGYQFIFFIILLLKFYIQSNL